MKGFALAVAVVACAACGPPAPDWQIVGRHLPAAVSSVWGTSANDVFLVGGDAGDGHGPLVEHFDGTAWTRLDTGQTGDLWWVFGFPNGPVFLGGDGGKILRYQNGTFTRMTTPDGVVIVFGIWGAAPDDVWAVGGAQGGANGAFAWRLQGGGDTWLPAAGFPADLTATGAVWKMYGRAANDAWMVGTNGKVVRWDGATLIESTVAGESLFTVHADAQRFVAVGGFGTGKILENDGSGWHDTSPPQGNGFVGVCLSPTGDYAVGQQGDIYTRGDAGWIATSLGFLADETLHSVWVEPSGGVWAVGGQLTLKLLDGIVLHQGARVPQL